MELGIVPLKLYLMVSELQTYLLVFNLLVKHAEHFQLFINRFKYTNLDVGGHKIMCVSGGGSLLPLSYVFWGNIKICVLGRSNDQ